ncbi:MAG: hypothetical protein AVO38_10795 [delta proteobacterium ML8_D]|jgi:pimeloyl-ACP methyl ester carboxylesterase|nr:MAG: hypothetical protein AVO38_10795 [delta proteobacterium ML8_D]
MYKKIFVSILCILAIIAFFILYRIYYLGAFVNIKNFNNTNCSILAHKPGPEDLEIDHKRDILYFISYDRWASAQRQQVRGEIYSLDLKTPQIPPKPLLPDQLEDFHPHGISLYQDDKGNDLLFVINHRKAGRQTIEVFKIRTDQQLQHLETIESKLIKLPNDLVATGPKQFYLTDINRSYGGLGLKIDALFQSGKGRIFYYDGSDFQVVAEDLCFPNGINIDNRGELIYVSETLAGNINVFKRDPASGCLSHLHSHFIRVGLDNITVLENGEMLVAVQPNLIALARHFKDPEVVSPSQVLKLRINKEKCDFEEIYSNSGNQLSGASVAAMYKNDLIIGSASEAKILYCRSHGVDITLDNWQKKGGFATIKSHQIFYVMEGEGPALLLLHAYPTASWGWHRVWPELAKSFKVVAPDLLGSGFSDKPKGGNYSIIYLTDIVEELLNRLGIREVHILAHAYGSLVAQELIARFNDSGEEGHFNKSDPHVHISSICFINGGIFPEEARTTWMQRFLLTPVGAAVAGRFPTPYKMFERNFSSTFGTETRPSPMEMKEFWELLTYNNGHRRVPEVIQYLNERIHKRDRWVTSLQKTRVPLCLINSNTDKFIGQATTKKWQDLLPGSSFIELASPVGHYPPLEDPDRVIDSYFEFMEKHIK